MADVATAVRDPVDVLAHRAIEFVGVAHGDLAQTRDPDLGARHPGRSGSGHDRPPRRQMTVGRLLAAIHLTVAAFFPQIWQAGPEAKTLKSHRPPHCRSAVRDRLPAGATGT